MKTISIAALAFLASFSLLHAADNRELRIGVAIGPSNTNPIMMSLAAERFLFGFCGRGLVGKTPEGNWEPRHVVTIPTLDNGLAAFIEEDGVRKIRAQWEIKKEAVWGDGVPITARDVVFAWETALADTVFAPHRSTYATIERIEIDPYDPKKFTMVFNEPTPQFAEMETFNVLPAHLEGPVFKERGGESGAYEKNSTYIKDPTNPGLYSGPYRLQEMSLGSHLILVPNENWYGKPPAIQKIVLKIIPDSTALEASLMSGAIDMIQLSLRFDQARSLEKRLAENGMPFRVNFVQSPAHLRLVLNVRNNSILKSLKVRKALVYATDRDSLCDSLFDGKIEKSILNYLPTDPWYTNDPEKIVLYRHSKRTARKLLDEEGWLLSEDGYRYKDGKKLSLEVVGNSSGSDTIRIFLQSEWNQIGVELSVKSEASRVFFAETVRRAKFQDMVLFSKMRAQGPVPVELHSGSIPTVENDYSGWNVGGWSNPEVDALLDAMGSEFDLDKQRDLAHKFLYHYTNEVPEIPLYYGVLSSVTPANLEGYHLDFVFSGDQAEYWNLKN